MCEEQAFKGWCSQLLKTNLPIGKNLYELVYK